MPSTLTLIRFADLEPVPWRNGGGVTRQIAAEEYDGQRGSFRWRVTIADVTGDGPFSTFADVDRQLVLVDGAGMVITVDGQPHRLDLFDVLAFPGDVPCVGALVDGPTMDLNVMTDRAATRAEVRVVVLDGRHRVDASPDAELLIVALAGSSTIDEVFHLGRFDTARIHGPATVELTGTGRVAVIDLQA